MEFISPELLAYCEAHTQAEDSLLLKITRETQAKVLLPRMLSGHLQGKILEFFAKMMQRFGVSLRVACDGQHAVDLYKAQPPDIIFMDISMPKLDGLQAAKVIRGLDEVRGVYTPIIALTAHAMPGDETRILAAGMDHYLSKPVRLQSVVDQLRHFHQQRLRARPL